MTRLRAHLGAPDRLVTSTPGKGFNHPSASLRAGFSASPRAVLGNSVEVLRIRVGPALRRTGPTPKTVLHLPSPDLAFSQKSRGSGRIAEPLICKLPRQ